MNQTIDGPLAVLVILEPQPGRRDEVLAVIRAAFGRIRAAEQSCLFLAAHVKDESDDIMLYELWSDRSSFNAFVQRPDMVEYLADLDTRLTGRRASQWLRGTA